MQGRDVVFGGFECGFECRQAGLGSIEFGLHLLFDQIIGIFVSDLHLFDGVVYQHLVCIDGGAKFLFVVFDHFAVNAQIIVVIFRARGESHHTAECDDDGIGKFSFHD